MRMCIDVRICRCADVEEVCNAFIGDAQLEMREAGVSEGLVLY
jgi:hypothetical protein